MPLIILGIIVIISIALYGLFMYANSEETDTRPVRERYAHIFDNLKKGANYTVIEDDDEGEASQSESGHTMHFPDDAEEEKRKRNIH